MQWTNERLEELKKLWAEGLSASQIAAQLKGVSRNAVIGKVHREGLPGRAKSGPAGPIKRKAPAAATKAPEKPQSRTWSRVPSPAPTRQATRQQPQEIVEVIADDLEARLSNVVMPISRRLALEKLTERTCKWPVGDPLHEDFYFCGCESPDSSPYCTYHAKLAYQPLSERRRAAQAGKMASAMAAA